MFYANTSQSYVIEAEPEFHILTVNDFGDGNHPSPATTNDRHFLVGMKNLYSIGSEKREKPK